MAPDSEWQKSNGYRVRDQRQAVVREVGVTPCGVLFILRGAPVPVPRPSFSLYLMSSSEALELPVCGLVKDNQGSRSLEWKHSEPPPWA